MRRTFLAILLLVPAAASAEEAVRARLDPDGVQRVQIVGGSYFFRPSHVVVKAGKPVELTISKEGRTPHNFVIQAHEAGIGIEQELGAEPAKVRFMPGAPGKYGFYCSNKLPFVASHRERGMEGVLEVID
jgi:plastocyanin